MITFVGVSHLSLNTGIGLASKGYDVTFIDCQKDLINNLKEGKLPFFEPGLDEYLTANRDKIHFETDFSKARGSELVYIAQDVKTNDNNESDLADIDGILNDLGKVLDEKSEVVIHCQVPVGYTRKYANKFKGKVYYQVETLIFGKALQRVLEPERYIVGLKSEDTELSPYYKEVLEKMDCPILLMNFESAELCKMSINMYLVGSVTITNLIAEICEHVGAKWDNIKEALKLDKRIGKHAYLNPGLGISGGNLERDMVSLLKMSAEHGTKSELLAEFIQDSDHRKRWCIKKLFSKVIPSLDNPKICILGLSYTPNSSSIKNSPSIELLKYLDNFEVKTYDPQVKGTEGSKEDAIKGADVIIAMTPWDEFKGIEVNSKYVIDPFNIIKTNNIHYTLGNPPKGE